MSEAKPEKRELPFRLAALLAAFSQKLSGEQMLECIRETQRIDNPTLNYQADRILRWVLEDDDVAAWYGFERKEGLEQIEDLRRKVSSALRTVTATGDYSFVSELASVERNARDARARYTKMIEELQATTKEAR